MQSGIYSIYKPKGPTSHDIINQLRRITGIKKIGHAGTLDPQAQGVLVVGIGREATKKLGSIVKKEKEYLAEVKLGETSTTFDAEGPLSFVIPVSHVIPAEAGIHVIPTQDEIKKITKKFIGHIQQAPPQYSAVKIKGKPAYKYARQGKLVEIKPREVEIKEIKIIKYKWPILKIKVVCGPGVYIRSLANDVGQKLKTGGYLLSLERTRVGDFKKEDSVTIEKFSQIWQNGR